MRSFVLRGGFQLLRFLYHPDDTVIASAAEPLVGTDYAFAFLDYCPGIYISAVLLMYRKTFTCHRRLIHSHLTGNHLAVERYHIACPYDEFITDLYLAHRHQHFSAICCVFPYPVYIERHGACQISHRLLASPVFHYLSDIEKEHYRRSCSKVASYERYRDSRGIQYRYFDPPVCQTPEPRSDISDRPVYGHQFSQWHRHYQFVNDTSGYAEEQFVLKLPVQCSGCVIRNQFRRLLVFE